MKCSVMYLRYAQVPVMMTALAKTRAKPKTISEQLRAAILSADVSRYRIARECDIGEGQLSRFVNGKGGLSLAAIDRIAALLDLELTARKLAERKGR